MDFIAMLKQYRWHLVAMVVSIPIVTGSFFVGWITTVTTPLFVFLVFKFLKVWRNKHRAIFGVPAIFVGGLLFFLIFSYQIANVEVQEFNSYHGYYHVTISPYSTTDFSRVTRIEIVYNNATNEQLHYFINSTYTNTVVKEGDLEGTIKNNKTVYHLNVTLGRGVYVLVLKMNNTTDYGGEIIRDYPNNLFSYFFYYNGLWVILWLEMLYVLLLFGVEMIRRSMDLRSLRYE